MMEAWTMGKVSALARRAWLAREERIGARRDRSFDRVRGGYRMIGWESEIAMCRALGRGAASGLGKEAHRYDRDK